MRSSFFVVTFGPALRCLSAIARIEDAASRGISWRDDVLDAERYYDEE